MQDAALARCSKPTTGHYSTMLQYPASLEPHMCTACKHLYKLSTTRSKQTFITESHMCNTQTQSTTCNSIRGGLSLMTALLLLLLLSPGPVTLP